MTNTNNYCYCNNNILMQVHLSFAKLEPFSVALTKGFKKQYSRWWPVADLACRYIFVVTVVLSVGNKVLDLSE
jgi:hypothetical protein